MTFKIGDRVRLTAKFLRSTGQYSGREPQSIWTVTGFSGPWLVTDEPLSYVPFTPDELTDDPSLRFRRIHPGNVRRVR